MRQTLPRWSTWTLAPKKSRLLLRRRYGTWAFNIRTESKDTTVVESNGGSFRDGPEEDPISKSPVNSSL